MLHCPTTFLWRGDSSRSTRICISATRSSNTSRRFCRCFSRQLEWVVRTIDRTDLCSERRKDLGLVDWPTARLDLDCIRIYVRRGVSQAGRRGFDPRLPLLIFNKLSYAPAPLVCLLMEPHGVAPFN